MSGDEEDAAGRAGTLVATQLRRPVRPHHCLFLLKKACTKRRSSVYQCSYMYLYLFENILARVSLPDHPRLHVLECALGAHQVALVGLRPLAVPVLGVGGHGVDT